MSSESDLFLKEAETNESEESFVKYGSSNNYDPDPTNNPQRKRKLRSKRKKNRKRYPKRKRKRTEHFEPEIDFVPEDINETSISDTCSKEDEYFSYDTAPIQEEIISSLMIASDLDPKTIRKIVRNTFRNTGHLLKGYATGKPSDRWKLGLSQKEIKSIEPELKRIRKIIDDETPTVSRIIKSNLTDDDKKRAIKLFDILNNNEPYTVDYNRTVDQINNIIRKGNSITREEIKRLDQIEKQLKELVVPSDNLKNRILLLNAPLETKAIIYGQYLEMLEHEAGSQKYNSLREEIEWSVRLPHQNTIASTDLTGTDNEDRNKAYIEFMERMDNRMYGMEEIKSRLLHIQNDWRTGKAGSIIGISGPPGVGKTAVAKAFAEALKLPFQRISLGGMEETAMLKGSNKVYDNSEPSIILQLMSQINSSKGVVMLDEVDKLESPKGMQVQYTLLHILDYNHNKKFRDSYLNKYYHDISGIIFVLAMNDSTKLHPALKNRLDMVEIDGYTDQEKKIILRDYVLPRALESVGLSRNSVKFDNKAINRLVTINKTDPGIREIEKWVKYLVERINMYNSVVLPDGTTGNLTLGYEIPNFKLPLTVNLRLLDKLMR